MKSEPNFAEHRRSIKGLNLDISEPDIYRAFITMNLGKNWNVQTTPATGNDGKYHMLYLSERDDGKFYVGKHSTSDLNDGYQGSGIDVVESRNTGHTFKTTPLEFFRSEDAAYDAEAFVVNERFITESPDIVLNHTVGGRSTSMKEYDAPVEKPTVTCGGGITDAFIGAVPVKTSSKKKPAKNFSGTVKKGTPCKNTFTYLTAKFGDTLTFANDESITCRVVDDWKVERNGKTYRLLKYLTNEIIGGGCKNPLFYWKLNGKRLSDICDEIARKGN